MGWPAIREAIGPCRASWRAAYQRIGDVYGDVRNSNLGNTTAALASYRKALSLLDSVTAHDPADRNAAISRVMIHYRVAGIPGYTQHPRRHREPAGSRTSRRGYCVRGIRQTTRYADRWRRSGHRSGDLQRLAGEHTAAFEENSKGLALLLESAESHPGDRSLQYSLTVRIRTLGWSRCGWGGCTKAWVIMRRPLPRWKNWSGSIRRTCCTKGN